VYPPPPPVYTRFAENKRLANGCGCFTTHLRLKLKQLQKGVSNQPHFSEFASVCCNLSLYLVLLYRADHNWYANYFFGLSC
jgi:hypothetical protein